MIIALLGLQWLQADPRRRATGREPPKPGGGGHIVVNLIW
jgi:hypothetical protein